MGQHSNSQSTNHLYPFDFYKAFKELRKFLHTNKKYDEVEKSYIAWALDGCAYNITSIKDENIKNRVMKKVFTNGLRELGLKKYKIVNAETCYNFHIFEVMFNDYKSQISKFVQKVFSLRNSEDKRHKIITVLGIKLKLKRNK